MRWMTALPSSKTTSATRPIFFSSSRMTAAPRARIGAERSRLEVEPEAVRLIGDAEIVELDAPVVRSALQRRVGVGRDVAVDHVELSGFQPQELRVLIRDDFDRDAIQVRQCRAV